jgi:hypothetical protein
MAGTATYEMQVVHYKALNRSFGQQACLCHALPFDGYRPLFRDGSPRLSSFAFMVALTQSVLKS